MFYKVILFKNILRILLRIFHVENGALIRILRLKNIQQFL